MVDNTITVDVCVGKELRDFIVKYGGTDLIIPDKGSNLWCLVKQHLQTVPTDYHLLPDRSEYIRIKLLQSGSRTKAYCLEKNAVIKINTIFRSYLDSSGQYVIKRYFEKEFKNVFRVYMRGCMNNNPDIKILEAITEFCLDYNIEFDKTFLSKLQKDWYRFKIKDALRPVNPLCF